MCCTLNMFSLTLLLLAAVPRSMGFFFDLDDSNSTSIELLSLFRPWFNLLVGNKPTCGPPRTCPNYTCRNNPAVVHGYCCGCASPFDTMTVPCPGNLQCPIFREPLCTDYRYMVDCCCDRQ